MKLSGVTRVHPILNATFPRKHDVIFWYQNGDKSTFNADAIRVPYTKLNEQKSGGGIGGQLKGELREDLLSKGKIIEDWWSDLSPVGRIKRERTGYPTQKPLKLIERIIKASSNEGDVILDPFCGCATTCVAAEKLDRKWIGIDISVKAYELVQKRLKKEVDKSQTDWLKGDTALTMRTDPPVRTDQDADHRGKEICLCDFAPEFRWRIQGGDCEELEIPSQFLPDIGPGTAIQDGVQS